MVICQRIKKIICKDKGMPIKRNGAEQTGAGDKPLLFARAVEANGWLHGCGQVAFESGETIEGGINSQTQRTIANLLAILAEAGYAPSIWSAAASGSITRATYGASTRSVRTFSTGIRPPVPAFRHL
jgi:enamine deaminase RidA (YjgF/YER057c/UK114 family)